VFGLNSNLTDNISSTWAAALPKFIRRRGALTGEEQLSMSSSFVQSDSEISYSMCRVSVESRSHSLDSTISVKAFEMTRKVRRFSKHVKKKHKRSNKLVCKLPSSQKGSVTSQDINRQVRYKHITHYYNFGISWLLTNHNIRIHKYYYNVLLLV